MMADRKKAMMSIFKDKEPDTEAEQPNEMHAISQEAINCIHAHDVAGFADCLSAAFELLSCKVSTEEV